MKYLWKLNFPIEPSYIDSIYSNCRYARQRRCLFVRPRGLSVQGPVCLSADGGWDVGKECNFVCGKGTIYEVVRYKYTLFVHHVLYSSRSSGLDFLFFQLL